MKEKEHRILYMTRMVFRILMIIGIVYAGDAFAGGFAVVVNKSNDTDNVSFNDLTKYFTAKKRYWPNRKKVVIILPKEGTEEKDVLLKKVYKLSEDELKKKWVGMVYRGQITSPPKTARSSVIRAVTKAKGGISILKIENVTDEVKVLKIDGKLPSEPGFLLVK